MRVHTHTDNGCRENAKDAGKLRTIPKWSIKIKGTLGLSIPAGAVDRKQG
jgi:hypothetical protein